MPAVISAKCPHCQTDKMAFSWVADKPLPPPRKGEFLTLFSCNKCGSGLVAEYHFRINHGYSTPGACNGDPESAGFQSFKKYPGTMPSAIPSHTPTPLDRYFSQAADALLSGHSDASGAMSRKVVDVSTQQLLKEGSKKYGNIRDRIDALAATNLLRPELKDWAHQIRLGGNDAAHDQDPYTIEEASELLSFVELYLTYVYSLPGRLKTRRDAAEQAKQEEKAKKPNRSTDSPQPT
jgi:hypothetical protein